MIKLRSGIFETNSSSTHACIICKSDKYEEWCKGILTAVSPDTNEFLKYSEKYNIDVDEGFVKVSDLSKIPMSAIFEADNIRLQKYIPESENVTFKDAYDEYRRILTDDPDAFNYWSSDVLETSNTDLIKVVKVLSYTKEPPTVDHLQNVISEYMGIADVRCISIYGDNNQYVDTRTFDEGKIICISSFGHD